MMFSRISLAVLLLNGSVASAICNPPTQTIEKDVVIVGAGVAGVAAARRLQEVANGAVTYAVLEAADDVGGRVRSRTLDGDFVGGWTIEDGANWIYDFPGNPIFDLAREYGLKIVLQDFLDIAAYDAGNAVDDRDVFRTQKEFDSAWKELQQKTNAPYTNGRETLPDTGAVDLLRQCGWQEVQDSPEDNLRYFMQWLYINYEYAQSDVSLSAFPSSLSRTKGFFVVDQNGGYQGLLKWYAEGVMANIHLNHEVQSIEYGSAPIGYPDYRARLIVQEKGGECKEFITKRVISTVSVGVLEKRSDELFHPSLDMDLNPLRMMQYVKIFYQFPNKFWGNDEFIATLRDVPDRGICHHWQNLDTNVQKNSKGIAGSFLPGSNILFCTILTEEFYQIADLDRKLSSETLDSLLDPLRDAFQEPLNDYSSYYPDLPNDDFLGHGAYANWPPQSKSWEESVEDYFKFFGGNGYPYGSNGQFFQAVNGYQGDEWVLHLSGSGSCFWYWETVHGGYFAGRRSANYVLNDFNYGVSTVSECEAVF